MKRLIIADTHLGKYKNSDFWIDLTFNFFNQIIEYCLNNHIKQVIHLGDWHEERKSLNNKTLNKSLEIAQLFQDNKIELLICIGNHDIYYKNQIYPHSLSFLNKFSYINIIDKPIKINNEICLVPWLTNDINLNEISCKYLMGHFEINGFLKNDNEENQDSKFSVDDFKKFDLVLSGHFHTPSKNNNVLYIGSPFYFTFGDLPEPERGFYIFENGEIEKVVLTNVPKFVKISTENEFKKEEIYNNFVKVVFEKDYGLQASAEILAKINSFNPIKVVPDYSQLYSEKENQELTNELNDPMEILLDYIDKMSDKILPDNISRTTLKKIVKKEIEK